MILSVKHISIIFCFIILYFTGCGFDNPYVPDEAGSSSLTGRIISEPVMDMQNAKILLEGEYSFATITDTNGVFNFQDIPPGIYDLHIQKSPYLQEAMPVIIKKSTQENLGDVKFKLNGAISGIIPEKEISIVHGEIDITIYVDGVPLLNDQNEEVKIQLSSEKSKISVNAVTKIIVYVDSLPYSAVVQDKGIFIVEFVPPGVYNDVRIKLNSGMDKTFPIVSGEPVVVNSGQTRFLATDIK